MRCNTNNKQVQLRLKLYELLGKLPPRDMPISAQSVSIETREGFFLEKLILELNGIESVPAYFVKPLDSDGPFPVVLYSHSHGENYILGKDELLEGCSYIQPIPYAKALTEMGFAVLCIDSWCFGERSGRSESTIFKEMLWHGQVLWGMMVYDSLRALDYLLARPDVNSDVVVALGMSMGATMSWWIAALEERVTACVDICCMTDFDTFLKAGELDRHGLYYYVPDLLNHFSTADINALIAPRLHLSLAGIRDEFTPPEGLDRIDIALKHVYGSYGSPENWTLKRYDCKHIETPEMRMEIEAFLGNKVLAEIEYLAGNKN